MERKQLADVSQGPVPMWLCSETTAQFQELSVLLDKSKSQTLDPCLVIVSKAESSWSELTVSLPICTESPELPLLERGDQSIWQGRGEEKGNTPESKTEALNYFAQGPSGSLQKNQDELLLSPGLPQGHGTC